MTNFIAKTAYQPNGTAIAAGAARSTLAGGWIDVTGAAWSVLSAGTLAQVANSSSPWNTSLLSRSSGEATGNGKLRYRYTYNGGTTWFCLRMSQSGGNSTGYMMGDGGSGNGGTTFTIWSVVAGALSSQHNITQGYTLVSGVTYDVEITAVQTNGATTTLTVTYFDAITGAQLFTQSTTDTTAATQNVNGVAAIFNYGNVACTVSYLMTYADNASPSVATNLFVVGGNLPGVGAAGTTTANYFAATNGSLAANVTVTPSDGGAGGTFTSPITLASGSSQASANFRYTLALGASGTITLSVSNSGSLANPSLIPILLPSYISVLDGNIVWSPGSWDFIYASSFSTGATAAANAAQSANSGAYLKVAIQNTTQIVINLDTTTLSTVTQTPKIMYSLDAGAWVTTNLTSGATTLTVGTGLSLGTHTLELRISNSSQNQNRFSASTGVSPLSVLRITGFAVPSGASTIAWSAKRPKTMIMYGDSITEGVACDPANIWGQNTDDAYLASAQMIATSLNAEYGQIGFGSQGYEEGGSAGVSFHSVGGAVQTWDKFSYGRPRAITGINYVLNMQMTNDALQSRSTATIAADVKDWLTKARIAAGASSWLILVNPPGGNNYPTYKAALQTGLANYLSAYPSDAKAIFVDVSAVVTPVAAGQISSDGIHPYWWYHRDFGAAVGAAIFAATTATVAAGGYVRDSFKGH